MKAILKKKTLFAITFLTLFFTIPALPAQTNISSTGKKWAVFIAINDYREWGPLFFPIEDARKIKNVLLKHYGYQEENILELYNDNAKASDIRNLFVKDLQAKALLIDGNKGIYHEKNLELFDKLDEHEKIDFLNDIENSKLIENSRSIVAAIEGAKAKLAVPAMASFDAEDRMNQAFEKAFGREKDGLIFSIENEFAILKGYKEIPAVLYIPDKVDSLPVISIGDYAFYGNSTFFIECVC
jgi:hypothetical protein